MIRTLVIVLGLTAAIQAACPASNELAGVIAGSVSFAVASNNNAASSYTHRFASALSGKPSIAFGIFDSDLTVSPTDPFGQFSVKCQPSQSGLTFDFKYAPRVWRSLRLGFLASTRTDLLLGSYSANLGGQRGTTSTQTVQVGAVQNFQKAIARPFINGVGISADSKAMQVQIEARSVQQSSVVFAVTTGPDTAVSAIHFSYIVFNPQNVPFASYGGSVFRNGFTGSGYQNIASGLQASNYIIYGIVRISAGSSLSLSSNLDSDFNFEFKNNGPAVDFAYSYVAIGPAPKSVCQTCDDKYGYGDVCITQCPDEAYPFTFKDGGLACRKCSPRLNLVVNADKNGCTCAPGFQLVNGNCVAVVSNSMDFSSDFASAGIAQSGSQVTSVTQNVNGVAASITISKIGGSGASIAPTITTVPSKTPTVNPPSGGGAIIIQPAVPSNDNSYVPTAPVQPPTQPPQKPTSTADTAVNAQSCAHFLNTYWTGYKCSCRVGYKIEPASGQCVKIGIIRPVDPPYVPPTQNCKDNEIYIGNQCTCREGLVRNMDGKCAPANLCPDNSYLQNGECICRNGFVKKNEYCVPSQDTCPPNSYFNGILCVCNPNYVYDSNNRCVLGDSCPPYSEKKNGVCVCIRGYREISKGVCSQCENGAVFVDGECVFTCGVNQKYNPSTKKCECITGYGFQQGVCSQCVGDFFLLNGYCVTCPLYATYNQANNQCECSSGSQIVNGQCTQACPVNQVFDDATLRCKCLDGLVLQNGQCSTCPLGTIFDLASQKCVTCQSGQILQAGKCVCQPGLGVTLAGSCANCASIGANLINGYCVICPNGKTWVNGVCSCPPGQSETDGTCKSNCKPNELIDADGHCYSCPINEKAQNGACVCVDGYKRDPASRACVNSGCPSGQYLINGFCGYCAMGTQYSTQLKACVCPTDYYFNQQGYCEALIKPPIVCSGATYLSGVACAPCPAGCSACTGPSTCTACLDPSAFVLGGRCVTRVCGNGNVEAGEDCDDGNNRSNDGCNSFCQVESGYECSGNPSICRKNTCGNGQLDSGEQCDDRNAFGGDGCSANCLVEQGYSCTPPSMGRPSYCVKQPVSSGMVVTNTIINAKTVYVTLKTDTAFQFASPQEMQEFMKYSMPPEAQPASSYCRQRPYPDLRTFDCLFNYPTRIPTASYVIQFSYNKDGIVGSLPVTIEPAKSQISSRSLK